TSVTASVENAGAPDWAKRLRLEKPASDVDQLLPSNWRDAWDHAAADAYLTAIDKRNELAELALEREQAEKRRQKCFAELVREKTFYLLDRRLSHSVKAALVEFVSALIKIPKTPGAKTAPAYRQAAREAMARCYDALPCWIMPTYRVAEQLPPEFG